MKAQATIEFLFMFLASMAFVTLLFGAMSLASKRANQQADIIQKTLELEEQVRTIEAYSNIGLIMVFDYGEAAYRTEGGAIEIDYKNKTIIVVEGIANAGTRIEPL
jgi:hypothetical protein